MRPSRIFNTVRNIQLEKTLLGVPRRQRAVLRSYVTGRRRR
ncbi:MAG: hypothetical protein WBD03_07405 [Thermoplasmata archaeon]